MPSSHARRSTKAKWTKAARHNLSVSTSSSINTMPAKDLELCAARRKLHARILRRPARRARNASLAPATGLRTLPTALAAAIYFLATIHKTIKSYKMLKINKISKPDWFNSKTHPKEIVEELLKSTDYHCSYSDKKIMDARFAAIDRFVPKSLRPELADEWDNLFAVDRYVEMTKGGRYDDKMLNPSETDYDFDRYFSIDDENLWLIPNPEATENDIERANITIKILGLNHPQIVQDRKRELDRYFLVYNLLKEKTELEGKTFDPGDHKELDIANCSYRFLLERALKRIQNEQNEYIQEIVIRQYFGIKDLVVSDLGDKKEIYFLGENGDGKTLLLQAILLAIRGLNSRFLNQYITENLYADFKIRTKDVVGNQYFYNHPMTSINKNVYAYGASRLRHSHQNDSDNGGYLTLFDFDAALTNPIQWLKEVERKELKGIGTIKLETAMGLLTDLLENRVEIQQTKDGEFVFIERGTKVSFGHLSDGYRSTLIWLCDLISRLSSNQPSATDLKQYKGIVLVDEIGVFLHPRWEFSIVKKLRDTFPNIQWIFTTHSPIVILGASKDAAIYRLYKEEGITKLVKPYDEPLNMTANSLLTSMLWRLDSFTTSGIQQQGVSSDDYPFQKIHQAISKSIQEVPELNDDKVLKMIEEEFEKIRME